MRGSVCSENRFVGDLPFEFVRICNMTEPRQNGAVPIGFADGRSHRLNPSVLCVLGVLCGKGHRDTRRLSVRLS